MGELHLTDEQQAAVTWIVEQLTSGVSLVALRGLAGTGKTTLIPALRQALDAVDIPVSIGSPTHRAAMILKRKGLSDATTLHRHALTPYFTLLTRAKQCLGFLTQHVFTQATQVSVGPVPWPADTKESPTMVEISHVSNTSRLAPMFTAAPDGSAETPTADPAPLTDDIPEIQVPASVAATLASEGVPPTQEPALPVDATMALLEGKITDWVASQSTATLKVLDQVYGRVASCLDKIAVANDHAQYQLANALDRLGEAGVQIHGTPYMATVQAISPQGFPLTLTLRKRSAEELVTALEQVGQWLHGQDYRPPSGAWAAVRLPDDDEIPF